MGFGKFITVTITVQGSFNRGFGALLQPPPISDLIDPR